MGAVWWNEHIASWIGAASHPFSSLRKAQGTGIVYDSSASPYYGGHPNAHYS